MKIESTAVKKKGNPKRSKRTIDDDESDYKESESDQDDWFEEEDSLEENKINKSVQKLNSFTYSEWKPQL